MLNVEVGPRVVPRTARPPTARPLAPGFRVPPPPAAAGLTAIGSSGTRYRTGTATARPTKRRAAAELTDERLRRHAAHGGYLVLTVAPNHQERAIEQLEALGAVQVDADRIVIDALRAEAAAKGIDWDRGHPRHRRRGPGRRAAGRACSPWLARAPSPSATSC